ncbi:MAG: tetratricopeptide repeat protein [Verrucomicrobia bacterium]|nr:tetratricopeptide repeat protein [Verrucomicrobiota bacterium]
MAFNRHLDRSQTAKRMVDSIARFFLLFGLFAAPCFRTALGAGDGVDEILKSAQAAFGQGDGRKALALVEKAIQAEPANPQALYFSARLNDSLGRHEKATLDLSALLKLQPDNASLLQLRGSALFKSGKIKESITDFDKEIELSPDREPYHWQRGISYYYAGEFEKGRQQFESHRSVNRNDVENAVWHFLCVVRSSGLEKAREALIPIANDGRIPMMTINALFAGKEKPESVLDAAEKGGPPPDERIQRRFYAHLYLGLYFEAIGDAKLAEQHILKAVDEFPVNHYMGDVARVHAKLRGYASKTLK